MRFKICCISINVEHISEVSIVSQVRIEVFISRFTVINNIKWTQHGR